MARKTYKTEENTEFNIDNITVLNKLYGGELYAYKIIANNGFVMYDATAEDKYTDAETGAEVPCVHYYRNVDIPIKYGNAIKDYVAVEESAVNKDFIF